MYDPTQKYLYGVVNEEQRSLLQHHVLKPTIQRILVEILEKYGLRQRLEVAKQTGNQLLILEAGSGSGSLLQDFANLLHQNDLLQAVNLNGVDINLSYVQNAEELNKKSPAWANINYYQHDITQPLEGNYSLNLEKKLQFDCICATVLLQYFPNAHQHILRLYNYLKPGGVLYLCDSYMAYGGEKGWQAPIPGIEKFGLVGTKVVRNINGGKIIAKEAAQWLSDAGAEQVQAVTDLIQAKGSDSFSLEVLRYYIAVVRTATPIHLKNGALTQAEHDDILASVFQITKDSHAQVPFIHTLARKPLANH
jgi:SAM-dependent methyltransferase